VHRCAHAGPVQRHPRYTGVWHIPAVEVELQRKAVALVQRIAGPEAAEKMRTLMLDV
jgi:hypothetical protein